MTLLKVREAAVFRHKSHTFAMDKTTVSITITYKEMRTIPTPMHGLRAAVAALLVAFSSAAFSTVAVAQGADAAVASAPLYGKSINVIGDSYVKNHRRPYTEAWHCLVAEKYHMTYRNYGRNGRCLVFDRSAEKWGKPMLDFYKEMSDTADYVLVVGGHNDADYIGRGLGTMEQFEAGLDSLCRCLIAKYPSAKLAFVTPWRVPRPCFAEVTEAIKRTCARYAIPVLDNAATSGVYVWNPTFRKLYFQGPDDTAHLNAAGHRLFMRKGETFLLGL